MTPTNEILNRLQCEYMNEPSCTASRVKCNLRHECSVRRSNLALRSVGSRIVLWKCCMNGHCKGTRQGTIWLSLISYLRVFFYDYKPFIGQLFLRWHNNKVEFVISKYTFWRFSFFASFIWDNEMLNGEICHDAWSSITIPFVLKQESAKTKIKAR